MHSILAVLVLKRGIPTSIKFRTRGKQLEDGVLGEWEMHLPGVSSQANIVEASQSALYKGEAGLAE